MRKRLLKGVGYVGEGPYVTRANGKHPIEYNAWYDMIARCYDPNTQKRLPSYVGCSVEESWHDFQVFAEWFTTHRNYGRPGFQLDKDLMNPGNRIYSADNCYLVPGAVNASIILPSVNKTTNYVGVHWCKRDRRFIAQFRKSCEKIKLGYFTDPEKAYSAYLSAKDDYLKELAEKYKDDLHPRIYENLKNWIELSKDR